MKTIKKVKVCGMTSAEQIRALAKLKVDYAGLIFYRESPRCVSEKLLPQEICVIQGIQKVGVFVDSSFTEIRTKVAAYQLDAVQLHGSESPEFCYRLQQRIPVFKAFHIKTAKDLIKTSDYSGACSTFIFDKAGKYYGGNGSPFDWQILNHFKGTTPFFLSGGICPDDHNKIQNFSHPKLAGIDLNSRFEISPGNKDINLLNYFLCQFNTD